MYFQVVDYSYLGSSTGNRTMGFIELPI